MSISPSSTPRATPDNDQSWLPLQNGSLSAKSVGQSYINKHKHADWFVAFAATVFDSDEEQARLLVKACLFLRDFIPQGFTGQFAHIHGDDVMRYLLCHPGEYNVSRHKISSSIDSVWSKLEEWMSVGKDWREAHAKNKNKPLAPGLHTPAGLMALLVISYPDLKFRDRIDKLGIGWMAKSRRTLDVQDGFWKGIHADNLYEVFKPEIPRPCDKINLRADYNVIFGNDFPRCRTNLRPFLQPWARDLVVSPTKLPTAADIIVVSEENTSWEPDAALDPVRDLRQRLTPGAAPVADILHFIRTKLSLDKNKVFETWLRSWSSMVAVSQAPEDRLIQQSLFFQSARRFKNMYSLGSARASAYLLLDMCDCTTTPPRDSSHDEATTSNYRSIADADSSVLELSDRAVRVKEVLEDIASRRLGFFQWLRHHQELSAFHHDVVELEAARMQVIIRSLESDDEIGDATQSAGSAASQEDPASSERPRLLSSEHATTLKLTDWQLRLLISKTSLFDILTDRQRTRYCADHPDASIPAPAHHKESDGVLVEPFSGSSDTETLLWALFRDYSSVSRPSSSFPTSAVAHVHVEPPGPQTGQLDKNQSRVSATSRASTETPRQTSTWANHQSAGRRRLSSQHLVDSTSPTPSSNRWSAFKAPHKRPSSEENPDPKRVKLINLTQHDLAKQVADSQQDLVAAVNRLTEQAKANTTAQETRQFRGILENLSDNVKELVDSQAKLPTEEVYRELHQEGVRTLEHTIEGSLEAIITRKTTSTLDAVNRLMTRVDELIDNTTEAGRDGYLGIHCKAPRGYSQKEYEARLFRAGMDYIVDGLGHPDDGGSRDGSVLEQTMAKFPDLSEGHIIKAIEHVHVLAYARQLSL